MTNEEQNALEIVARMLMRPEYEDVVVGCPRGYDDVAYGPEVAIGLWELAGYSLGSYIVDHPRRESYYATPVDFTFPTSTPEWNYLLATLAEQQRQLLNLQLDRMGFTKCPQALP